MTDLKQVLKNKSILVVDDEPEVRRIIANEMRTYGIKTFEAENGNEAFEIIINNPINLVISDLKMPNGSGIELLEKIKNQKYKVPVVILMTGFSDFEKMDILKMGASFLLKKPLDWDKAFQKILSALLTTHSS